jgi:hypothetical protein
MVTPAARREAVAQLRVACEVSNGGRVRHSERIAHRSAITAAGLTMRRCGLGYVSWPGSPPVLLSAAPHPAHARRHHHEPQEAPPALITYRIFRTFGIDGFF